MNKFIKSIYYKIICYDPIIEDLYIYKDKNKGDNSSRYIASPIIINRRIRRNSRRIYKENNLNK